MPIASGMEMAKPYAIADSSTCRKTLIASTKRCKNERVTVMPILRMRRDKRSKYKRRWRLVGRVLRMPMRNAADRGGQPSRSCGGMEPQSNRGHRTLEMIYTCDSCGCFASDDPCQSMAGLRCTCVKPWPVVPGSALERDIRRIVREEIRAALAAKESL